MKQNSETCSKCGTDLTNSVQRARGVCGSCDRGGLQK